MYVYIYMLVWFLKTNQINRQLKLKQLIRYTPQWLGQHNHIWLSLILVWAWLSVSVRSLAIRGYDPGDRFTHAKEPPHRPRSPPWRHISSSGMAAELRASNGTAFVGGDRVLRRTPWGWQGTSNPVGWVETVNGVDFSSFFALLHGFFRFSATRCFCERHSHSSWLTWTQLDSKVPNLQTLCSSFSRELSTLNSARWCYSHAWEK